MSFGFRLFRQRSHGLWWRQCAVLMLAGLVLGACSERGTLRVLGLQQSYFGGVVGDPRDNPTAVNSGVA